MSNRTPKKPAAATGSAPRSNIERLAAAVIFSGLCLLFAVGVFMSYRPKVLRAPGGNIRLEVAETPQARSVGLSGRDALSADAGMLFVFDIEATSNCFWMKDTNIPLDFVWLDGDKQIVTVTSNVSPDSYPQSFCPDKPAAFGLEVNAGQAGIFGLRVGERVSF